MYFLWRITTFPELDNVDAILIGATITCVVILGSWGIGSGRGNPVESSLLVSLKWPLAKVKNQSNLWTVRIHHPLHLPDLHRLQAFQSFNLCSTSSTA
jgi:hypothetical protein